MISSNKETSHSLDPGRSIGCWTQPRVTHWIPLGPSTAQYGVTSVFWAGRAGATSKREPLPCGGGGELKEGMKNRSGYKPEWLFSCCWLISGRSVWNWPNGSALVWINDSKQPRGKVFAEVWAHTWAEEDERTTQGWEDERETAGRRRFGLSLSGRDEKAPKFGSLRAGWEREELMATVERGGHYCKISLVGADRKPGSGKK